MFSTMFIALALAASSASGHAISPSAAAIVTGTPFDMRPSPTPTPTSTPTPASELAARQNWASPPAAPAWSAPPAPAWSQPAVPIATVVVTATASATPSPSPTYTWDETHDDSKNTRTHEIIAIVICSILGGVVVLIFVPCMLWHRCWKGGRRVTNKGLKVPDVEDGRAQFRVGGNVGCAGMPQPPKPVVYATRGPDGRFSDVPL